mmetsp:Transcript_26798/g.51878  ORF Transcript_26798/g.51878 Transcript_26798/m.51878 type:complete len:83 (+) Transcript_26798:200-448(+)
MQTEKNNSNRIFFLTVESVKAMTDRKRCLNRNEKFIKYFRIINSRKHIFEMYDMQILCCVQCKCPGDPTCLEQKHSYQCKRI